MRWIAGVLLALVVTSGCRNILGYQDPVLADGLTGDDGGSFCYGTGIVRVCFSQQPSGTLSVTGTTPQSIDTTSSVSCSQNVISGGTDYCVLGFETISIASGATLEGTGSKPLVLVATDSITVTGTLDASSSANNMGAGANMSGCSNGTTPGTDGGGGGGSFGTKGGNGGGPNAGSAGAALTPTTLRGGCAGHTGGGPGEAKGGAGGGAVYAIAASRIDVAGAVNASGAGAERTENPDRAGGGGGGAGGMIGLDAPMISITGVVFAAGGGGCEGNTDTVRGNSGGDPINATGGTGGANGGLGGDGGNGAAGTSAGGSGADGMAGVAGAGGGGGGAGVIKIYGTRSGAGTIAPPPS